MLFIKDFWGWILFLTFIFSPGTRAAIGRVTQDAWAAAQAIAIFLEEKTTPIFAWTMYVLGGVIVVSLIGLAWRPALLFAALLLLVWFFLLRAGINAIIGALQTASQGILEPLVKGITGILAEEGEEGGGTGIDVEPTRQALVEALQAGVRPLTWLVVCAALWGIQIIVFPQVSGTTGLFVIFVVVALNLLGSLLGTISRLPERAAQFFVLIAIIVFAIELPLRNTLPGAAALELMKQANRKSTAAIRTITAGTWKGAVAGEHRQGLEREFNRPFRSSLYKNFWGEDPKIFYADGTEVPSAQYKTVIKDLESRPFVVVKDKAKIPKIAKEAVGGAVDLVFIQASPSQPSKQYIVPSRCIDWKSQDRLQAAKQGVRSAAETRGAEVEEEKLKQFSKVRIWQVRTDNAWFWRYDPKNNTVGSLEHPPVGSRWEIREEVKYDDLPDDIKNLEGADKMIFLKVNDVKNPRSLYIIRDMWGGEEVAHPFEVGRQRESQLPHFIGWEGRGYFLQKKAGYVGGFTIPAGWWNGYDPRNLIKEGTKIKLVPDKKLRGRWRAYLFNWQGIMVENIPLKKNHTVKHTGWLIVINIDKVPVKETVYVDIEYKGGR